MSGFLQRLASGVLHAQPAIHPAVGTIWSAAGMTGPGMGEPLATAEPFESSVEVRVPPLPRRTDAPAPPATQPSTQQPAQPQIQPERSAPVSESAVHKDAEQPAIAEAVAFQPLVASPQRRVVSALPPAPQANANPQQSETIPPPRHQATSPEHAGAQPLHRIETARLLVPAPPIPVPAPAGARKAPSFLPPSQRQAQPAASLAEEPDSIEIHIGRIEVLAAPPRPAQPAAPRPARKSLDLGEYLRGERRSR
jgi:hypothetical protein